MPSFEGFKWTRTRGATPQLTCPCGGRRFFLLMRAGSLVLRCARCRSIRSAAGIDLAAGVGADLHAAIARGVGHGGECVVCGGKLNHVISAQLPNGNDLICQDCGRTTSDRVLWLSSKKA